MKASRYILSIAAMLFSLGLHASTSEPLPQDPLFRVGETENGLTYYIRPCKKPAGHAEFYIVHNVGSLQEEDNQQGLAHFLEHMAFNGTKNFEGKNFLNYFASIGVKFGANINAVTSKDRTIYNISQVPTERKSVIDSTILALHDWSSFISCNPEEIEAERGVVREEWRRSDDAKMRMMKAIWSFEQQGSKFAQRDVIGDINIINNFTRDELVDYYHKWYRPDLQAVVVVGDIDADYIEQQIKTTFNKIPKATNPAKREVYTIEDHAKPTIGYFIDKDAKAASVRISVKIPNIDAESAKTSAYIEDEMKHGVLMSLVKNRFAALSKEKPARLRAAIPVTSELSYYGRTITITALPLNNDYNTALEALLDEYERIERFGFSQTEVSKAKAVFKMSFTQKNSQEQTNSKYVTSAVENYTRNRPLISHEHYCELCTAMLEELDAETMNSFAESVWGDKNRTIVFCGGTAHEKLFMPSEDVERYIAKVKNIEMAPYVMAETKGPKFRKSENCATIESHEFIDELNAKHVTLSNGLQIYWRQVKSARYPIEVNYITRKGIEDSPLEELNALKVLNAAASYATLSAMPKSQKEAWLDEQGIMVLNRVNDKYSRLALSAKSQDKFGTLLSLIDEYTNSMELNAKDFMLFKKQYAHNIEKEKSEFNIYSDSLERTIYHDPISIEQLAREELESVSKEHVEETFHNHFGDLSKGYLFILSTTSFDDVIEVINNSFSLETNAPRAEVVTAAPRIPALKYKDGAIDLHFKAKDVVSTKAQLAITYRTPSRYNTEERLMQDIFCNIFRDRLMALVREEMGATYSVAVSGTLHFDTKPYQTIEISLDTDPKLLDSVIEAIDITLAKLAKDGITPTELRNTKLYFEKSDEQRAKSGATFITEMIKYINSGVEVNHNRASHLEKINAKDIKRLARRYYKSKDVIKSSFSPEIK